MSKSKTIIKKVTINNYPTVTSEEMKNYRQEENSALDNEGFPKDMPEVVKNGLKAMGFLGKSIVAHGAFNAAAEEKDARERLLFIHDLIHSKVTDKTDILNMVGAVVCPKNGSLEDIYQLMCAGKDGLWTPEALKFLCEKLGKRVPLFNFEAANLRRSQLRADAAKKREEESKKETMPMA